MKKLSNKEWIAVAVAVAFVGYTLFGFNIMSLFQKSSMNQDASAAAVNTTVPNDKGLIINDIVVGQGPLVKKGDRVSVHYILSLSDGTTLQNSKDFGAPFKFTLGAGEVIQGWEMGFEGMHVGGVRTVVIPPELAYGNKQAGPIPPNSTLVFTIELVGIEPAPVQSVQ